MTKIDMSKDTRAEYKGKADVIKAAEELAIKNANKGKEGKKGNCMEADSTTMTRETGTVITYACGDGKGTAAASGAKAMAATLFTAVALAATM